MHIHTIICHAIYSFLEHTHSKGSTQPEHVIWDTSYEILNL